MRAEKIAAPCGHDDQGRDPKLGQFGVVAKKGSRPGSESGERQCHRAHCLAVYSIVENRFWMIQKNHVRSPRPLRAQGLHRYSDQFRKSSENTTARFQYRLTHRSSQSSREQLTDWPPDGAAESNVSGGSKKHLCQRAESDNVPALHC